MTSSLVLALSRSSVLRCCLTGSVRINLMISVTGFGRVGAICAACQISVCSPVFAGPASSTAPADRAAGLRGQCGGDQCALAVPDDERSAAPRSHSGCAASDSDGRPGIVDVVVQACGQVGSRPMRATPRLS